jgi:hypothetical protein
VREINKDGKTTSRWYKANFLKGNISKYQAMITNKNSKQLDIKIENQIIKTTEELKLLGVVIDKNLNFSEHNITDINNCEINLC